MAETRMKIQSCAEVLFAYLFAASICKTNTASYVTFCYEGAYTCTSHTFGCVGPTTNIAMVYYTPDQDCLGYPFAYQYPCCCENHIASKFYVNPRMADDIRSMCNNSTNCNIGSYLYKRQGKMTVEFNCSDAKETTTSIDSTESSTTKPLWTSSKAFSPTAPSKSATSAPTSMTSLSLPMTTSKNRWSSEILSVLPVDMSSLSSLQASTKHANALTSTLTTGTTTPKSTFIDPDDNPKDPNVTVIILVIVIVICVVMTTICLINRCCSTMCGRVSCVCFVPENNIYTDLKYDKAYTDHIYDIQLPTEDITQKEHKLSDIK